MISHHFLKRASRATSAVRLRDSASGEYHRASAAVAGQGVRNEVMWKRRSEIIVFRAFLCIARGGVSKFIRVASASSNHENLLYTLRCRSKKLRILYSLTQ